MMMDCIAARNGILRFKVRLPGGADLTPARRRLPLILAG
jgi:hypothetical protein